MIVRLVGNSRCQTRIQFVYKNEAKGIMDFDGSEKKIAVRYEGNRTVIYAGLGERQSRVSPVLRSVAALAVKKAAELKRRSVSLVLSSIRDDPGPALEGALLGNYVFDKYLSEKPDTVRRIEVVSPALSVRDVKNIRTICDAVAFVRDLVNDNATVVCPEHLATIAREIGKRGACRVRVLDERQLRRRRLGLLCAVGQGSPYPPRLIIMEYRGDPRNRETVAIAGKGITFDSGGLNLKPSGNIEAMRCDMAGAAVVLGVMKALTESRARVNVIGVCAAAHNAVDGNSYLPGDVYRSYNGKTVEICNSDAEGRLVLADAVSFAIDEYKPVKIIDLATLTGGILITFSDIVAGLFSGDDTLADGLFAAGEATNERLWRLPLYKEYSEAIKGDRSDLRNLAKFKRGHASSITGAAFLKEFVGDVPWAHLDIAGTAFNEGDGRAEIPKGGTGFGVRLLMHYLLNVNNA